MSNECLTKTTCETKEKRQNDKDTEKRKDKHKKGKHGIDKHGKGKRIKEKDPKGEEKNDEQGVLKASDSPNSPRKMSNIPNLPNEHEVRETPWKYSIELENIIKKLRQPVVGPNVQQEKYEFVYSILSSHFDQLCHEIDDLQKRLGVYQATTYPSITGEFVENPRFLMEEKNMTYRKVLKDYGFYPPRGDAKRPDYLDEIPLENYMKRYKLYFGIPDEDEVGTIKLKKKGKKQKKSKKDKSDGKKSKKSKGKKSKGKKSDEKKNKSKGKSKAVTSSNQLVINLMIILTFSNG